MNPYEILFGVGVIGFFIQFFLGFSHGGHSAKSHHGLKAVKVAKGVKVAKHAQHSSEFNLRGAFVSFISIFISPLDIFALCMGAGLGGLIAIQMGSAQIAILCAIAGAIVCDFFIIRPLVRFLLSFASKPSEGLHAAVNKVATAETKFDEKGRGLVKLELEGQVRQILGQLSPEEFRENVKVGRGETLVVLSIDPVKNTCVVSKRPLLELDEDPGATLRPLEK